jgi:hypothetical protein
MATTNESQPSATADYLDTMSKLDEKKHLSAAILRAALEFVGTGPQDAPPLLSSTSLICGTLRVGKEETYSPNAFFQWLAERASPSRVQEFLERHRSGRPEHFIVTPEASAILQRARHYARETGDGDLPASHHLVAALTTAVDLPARRRFKSQFGVSLIAFRPALLDYIKKNRGENQAFWQNAIKWPDDDADHTMVARVSADSVARRGSDPLRIRPDVQAFARLICLEDAAPPLSIAIFGEWGSGKSTFMEQLQSEIDTFTHLQRSLAQSKAAGPDPKAPKFVHEVVQIRFNAWHFADANLWASLTTVFFDQLRRGGYDGSRNGVYPALIGKVAEKVKSLEAGVHQAVQNVEQAKAKSDAAQRALQTAEQQIAASDLAIASDRLKTEFRDIFSRNAEALSGLGRLIGREDLAQDISAFRATVVEASSLSGKAALIGRVLVGGGLSTWLGLGAVLIIGAFSLGLNEIALDCIPLSAQKALAWTGSATAGAGSLWLAVRKMAPIFDGVWKYAKATEDERKRLAEEIVTKREATTTAAKKLDDAERALGEAQKPLQAYGGGVATDAPATVLRFFLFEDGDVRDYDKHIGIVSRARRSFEQLNAIVATTRSQRRSGATKQTGGAPGPQEQATAGPADNASSLQVPDRIVLYIDDLDRCTPEQVYSVLQAIHLLLSFELFVVVVGVDVRWIEGAIEKHVQAVADPGEDVDPNIARRRRAIDYLEKIFQLAFWLQKLDAKGIDGADSTYGSYIRDLLRPADEPTPPAGAPTGRQVGTSGVQPGPQGDRTSPLPGSAEPDQQTVEPEPAFASVDLEKVEVDFIASPEIGEIANKSPRAVKRLVNIYRIIRARLSEAALEELLGRTGRPPLYPIAIFLIAVETGQSIKMADDLNLALKSLPENAEFASLWRSVEPAPGQGESDDKGASSLQAAKESGQNLSAAIFRIEGMIPGATVKQYLRWAGQVRRYSFNRLHLQSIPRPPSPPSKPPGSRSRRAPRGES